MQMWFTIRFELWQYIVPLLEVTVFGWCLYSLKLCYQIQFSVTVLFSKFRAEEYKWEQDWTTQPSSLFWHPIWPWVVPDNSFRFLGQILLGRFYFHFSPTENGLTDFHLAVSTWQNGWNMITSPIWWNLLPLPITFYICGPCTNHVITKQFINRKTIYLMLVL